MTDYLDKAFRSTCRILLGQEIGALSEHAESLVRYIQLVNKGKSAASGKTVYFSENYCKGARIVSNPEAQAEIAKPLSMNEIKDIDSLFAATSERFTYAGDKILGNSRFVEQSDNCIDTVYAKQCREVYGSEYLAYCQMVEGSKYMFGCSWGTLSSFCINATEFYKSQRVFESAMIIYCADVHFSHNCNNSSNLMFCFNQFTKRHCIGNCQLLPDKFNEMKKKLLSEIAQDILSKKRIPSLVEMANGGK